ncbi:hypothetical protein A9G47_00440 [Gilliamella sp. WF3-4]|jgi:hypothetical protein|uniref:hypothetical protein n=1 Tax=Gilliamella sp. Nev3-1 TaxID=3120250 RepID=UPI00080E959A|nr:hypothetical protein [Gilliamella apicola]OCG19614.1 hypothetical protein A9G47_00440 [Gilliamella apicola]OCG60819.1 hypothetical protein A9G40_03120 [Gilliamella apicola]OCG77240.1 hypothetical protein A9G44_05435 [Gilliamella apicola]
MKISILIDESFDIENCESGYIVALMVNEWWVFLKKDSLDLIGVFETIHEVKNFISSLIMPID